MAMTIPLRLLVAPVQGPNATTQAAGVECEHRYRSNFRHGSGALILGATQRLMRAASLRGHNQAAGQQQVAGQEDAAASGGYNTYF